MRVLANTDHKHKDSSIQSALSAQPPLVLLFLPVMSSHHLHCAEESATLHSPNKQRPTTTIGVK
jgi:hypothetical protein